MSPLTSISRIFCSEEVALTENSSVQEVTMTWVHHDQKTECFLQAILRSTWPPEHWTLALGRNDSRIFFWDLLGIYSPRPKQIIRPFRLYNLEVLGIQGGFAIHFLGTPFFHSVWRQCDRWLQVSFSFLPVGISTASLHRSGVIAWWIWQRQHLNQKKMGAMVTKGAPFS